MVPASSSSHSKPREQDPGVAVAVDSPRRTESLDFVKGFLVLGMVVFHSINYFSHQYSWLLAYFRFVSGGFILVSGYIVTAVYAPRWHKSRRAVSSRLFGRGLKLIALFTLLNLGINALALSNFNTVQFGLEQFRERFIEIYGAGNGKYAAFEILLPIGYLLLLSPLALWSNSYPWVPVLMGLAGLVLSALLPGWRLHNANLLLVGYLGMLLGTIAAPSQLSTGKHLPIMAALFALSALAMPFLKTAFLGYLWYTAVALKTAMDACAAVSRPGCLKQLIVALGQNVLFCYLAHILLLQLIFRLLWSNAQSPWPAIAIVILGTSTILAILTRIATLVRRKSHLADRAYRLVFT